MTPPRTCPSCGVVVPVKPGRGRPRTFCTDRCATRHRVAAHRARRMPAEMTSKGRWVRRAGKRPLTVTGRAASVTDPATWTTYTAARNSEAGSGLGFVLGDGIACLDLDGVIDPAGNLDPAAAELLASLPATYTEVSMSGRGLHVFGLLPEAPGRKRTINGISVETYSRERFIATTANRWPGAPMTLADLAPALDW